MALSQLTDYNDGNVLTGAQLDAEFAQILTQALDLINPLTGALNFNGNGLQNLAAGSEAAPGLYFNTDSNTGFWRSAADTIDLSGAGARIVQFTGITSAVNYLDVSPNIAGSEPAITAEGTDTDVSIRLVPKGAGVVAVTGASTISSTLAVTSNATVGGTLGVTGATTVAAITASGAAILQSTLAVTGAVTLTVPLPVTGGGTGLTAWPRAKARRAALQTIANATDTTVNFDVTEYDSGSIVNLGTETFTIPTTGIYAVAAQCSWTANATGLRSLRIISTAIQGGNISVMDPSAHATIVWTQMATYVGKFTAADTITLEVRQESTVSLDLSPAADTRTHLSVTWIGPTI